MFIVIAVILIDLYFYISNSLSYWKVRGVAYTKPSFFGSLFYKKKTPEEQEYDSYNAFSDKRYFGTYQLLKPVLVIHDPELIREITVKSFDTFGNHPQLAPASADPVWSKTLFSWRIEDGWNDVRAAISPAFNSSKLKMMFELMQRCAEECTKYYQKQGGTVIIDAKDLFSRFTVDVIGTTTFGVSCNSYEQPLNEFYLMARKSFNLSELKFLGYIVIPQLMKVFNIRILHKAVVTFFSGLINESFRLRRENKLIRADLIHLLMGAQKGKLNHDSDNNSHDSDFSAVDESDIVKKQKRNVNLSDDDIIALALGFFVAGYDSTSNVMGLVAYELALNPDTQNKLFKEIESAPRDANGRLTHGALLEMKYLDMVISETMRKWPATWYLSRQCRAPFVLEPKNDGEKPLLIEKGMNILISVFSMHRNPQYYLDPEKFDPERFNEENKRNIQPLTYVPFGAGPRSCVGSRFALLEIKLIIEEIVRKFEIVPVEKTPIPITVKSQGTSFYPVEEVWLGLKPRRN